MIDRVLIEEESSPISSHLSKYHGSTSRWGMASWPRKNKFLTFADTPPRRWSIRSSASMSFGALVNWQRDFWATRDIGILLKISFIYARNTLSKASETTTNCIMKVCANGLLLNNSKTSAHCPLGCLPMMPLSVWTGWMTSSGCMCKRPESSFMSAKIKGSLNCSALFYDARQNQ